jgi:DNA repair photolyase
LHPTPLAGSDDVLGLNLLRGCYHRCAFCSVRAAPGQPSDEVFFFRDSADLLAIELEEVRPRAVFLSPATDPFPPNDAVQHETGKVVALLAEHGVEAWLMTRGIINSEVLAAWEPWRDKVRITIALTTLDASLVQLLEPETAPAADRLNQIARLAALGFPVQTAIEPLLPTVTDTPTTLASLLDGLKEAGVKSVSTSYLFLRSGIVEQMQAALPQKFLAPILKAYTKGPLLTAPGLATARYLPRSQRQRGYATVISLAASRGIRVTVSALTNPDFTVARQPSSGGG